MYNLNPKFTKIISIPFYVLQSSPHLDSLLMNCIYDNEVMTYYLSNSGQKY